MIDFSALSSVGQLAKTTCIPRKDLDAFLISPLTMLRAVKVPRRDRTRPAREAWDVQSFSVKIGMRLLAWALDDYVTTTQAFRYPHPAVHGFLSAAARYAAQRTTGKAISRRGALTNARVHSRACQLLTVDIENFFGSIRTAAVEQSLLTLGLRPEGAKILAQFVTLDDRLPLGFPTSPTISNIVMLEVDEQLAALAKAYNANYTRYADDLTFSGEGALPSRGELQEVVSQKGLTIHRKKYRLAKRGQAQYVTGYSVSDDEPRAPRKLKRQLRQQIHYVGAFGIEDHARRVDSSPFVVESQIEGRIAHVRQVEPAVGDELLDAWLRARRSGRPKARTVARQPHAASLFIDDSTFELGSVKYHALCFVELRDPATAREQVTVLADQFLLDPTMPDDVKAVVKARGLHFAELPEDFRKECGALIETTRLRAYITYERSGEAKGSQVARMLGPMLKWRLANTKASVVSVTFEQGEYITRQSAPSLVSAKIDELGLQQTLRVERVRVCAKPDEPCLALADILLGFWVGHACANEPKRRAMAQRTATLFERIARKIGTIYDASERRVFTARDPFQPLAFVPKPAQ